MGNSVWLKQYNAKGEDHAKFDSFICWNLLDSNQKSNFLCWELTLLEFWQTVLCSCSSQSISILHRTHNFKMNFGTKSEFRVETVSVARIASSTCGSVKYWGHICLVKDRWGRPSPAHFCAEAVRSREMWCGNLYCTHEVYSSESVSDSNRFRAPPFSSPS